MCVCVRVCVRVCVCVRARVVDGWVAGRNEGRVVKKRVVVVVIKALTAAPFRS